MSRVICSVCRRYYQGVIPKGGDGSILFPRKHNTLKRKYIIYSIYRKKVCPGSFRKAKEITK